MKLSRLIFLCLVVLATAVPSHALCIHCVVDECWADASSGRAECYSYGSSCLLAGAHCGGSGGGECDTEFCGPEEIAYRRPSAPQPLSLEYQLAQVTIQQQRGQALAVTLAHRPVTNDSKLAR